MLGRRKQGNVAADTSTKRQNSVWFGRMSYKAGHENLLEFFEGAGDITRINMSMKARVVLGKSQRILKGDFWD